MDLDDDASLAELDLEEEDEVVLAERRRVHSAPRPEEAAERPWLSRFEVLPEGSAEEYAARLRAVLGAALDHAVDELGIPGLEFSPRAVPDWFAAVCGEPGADAAPEFARRGAERYSAAGHGSGWQLGGWLERFEPDFPITRWSWWDLTRSSGEGRLSLWVDAAGEDFFSCDELRWAAYTAGAESVTGPELVKADRWQAEPRVP